MKTTKYFLFILVFVSFFSCSDEETLEESVLIENNETFVQVTESIDFITISVESLIDTKNDNIDSNTGSDFCNISFDINSNKAIDAEIDFGFESPTENYDICSYYFLDNDAITHCAGHSTTAVFTESFVATEKNEVPHMTWKLKISKEELNQTKPLNFTVKTVDNGQFRTYPTNINNTNQALFFFNKTLTFNW